MNFRRKLMGIMTGNPQDEPLHYGEVFSVWTHLSTVKAAKAAYQTLANHCGDEELRKFINDLIEQGRQEDDEITNMLKASGVTLPPSPPERADADLEEIPPGARFNDPEIAASVQKDLAAGLVACSQAMGQSTREDVALMFGQFHMTKAQNGAKLLKMVKQKGWLIPPPLHVKRPEEN
jgi:hypothetical protein